MLNKQFSSFVEKRSGGSSWVMSNFFTNNGLAINKTLVLSDPVVSVNSGYHHYRFVRLDPCGDGFDTSNIHTNVWLREINSTLYWNRYWGWLCNSCSNSITYNLLKRDPTNSTWVNIGSFQNYEDSFLSVTGKWEGLQTFKVEAHNNTTGKISTSNELTIDLGYDKTIKDTFLIPSGFTPDGLNPVFKISNPVLAVGESSMDIYNRWGEKLWTGDGVLGWSGRDLNGNKVGDGVYVYHVTAVYRNKRVVLSGSVLLLK